MKETTTLVDIHDQVNLISEYGFIKIVFPNGGSFKINKSFYYDFMRANQDLRESQFIPTYRTDSIILELVG